MHIYLLSMSVLLAATSIATAIYWGLVPVRLRRIDRSVRRLHTGLELPVVEERISVVVPAHNEARVIGHLVRSVLSQREIEVELVIALDRCTDASREEVERAAAGDARIRIVEIDECPEGWAGKCHAAARGAAVATGDWILFTDADVRLDPDAVRAAVAIARDERVDLLSAFTSLASHSWWHTIVQPPAAVALLRMFPPDRVNDEARPRSFANGQFMLFSRRSYDEVGGHEAVRGAVLEDLAFAAAVHQVDGRVRVVRADDMIVTDMYESLDDLLLGWRRIYIESAKRNLRRLRRNAILVFGSGIAPLACWAAISVGILTALEPEGRIGGGIAILSGIAGVLAQGLTLASIFRRGGFPGRGVLAWSLGCFLVSREIWRGVGDLRAGRPIRWGGREYILKPGPR